MSIPLETSATAYFDSVGRARLEIGPSRARQDWQLARVTTQTTSVGRTQPTLMLYKNAETTSALLGGTYTANNNTDDAFNVDIRSQEKLIAVWTGGTPESAAVLTVLGTLTQG